MTELFFKLFTRKALVCINRVCLLSLLLSAVSFVVYLYLEAFNILPLAVYSWPVATMIVSMLGMVVVRFIAKKEREL